MKDIGIIDLEASGLHFDSYPIEVAVLVKEETKSWLIKPADNWQYWCSTAESMHGITREQLAKDGIDAKQVATELNDFLVDSNCLLYSDAVYWDSDWINTLYFAAKIQRQFQIADIYDLLDGNKQGQFNETKNKLAESGKYRQHRAEEDVRMIYEAFVDTV